MPKSAAKAFVSAISDAMAFLVVDPVSGAVKKLKASAALASDSVDGLMSSDDKSKLAGIDAGPYTPTFTLQSGLTGTPTLHYAAFVATPIDGGPLVHVECTVRFATTLSGSGPSREVRITLPVAPGGNFSSSGIEGTGQINGGNIENGVCAPTGSAQTFRLIWNSTGSSGNVTAHARFSYDTVA